MDAKSLHNSTVVGSLLFGLFYLLAAWTVWYVGVVGEGEGLLWYPSGLAIYALVIFGWRLWPGIALGAVAFGVVAGLPPETILFVAAGQVGAGLVGFALLRRPGNRAGAPSGRPDVGRVAAGVLLAPLVAVAIGLLGHLVGGSAGFSTMWGFAARWTLVEMGSLVVLLPLILHRYGSPARRGTIRERFPSATLSPDEEDSKTFGETIGAAISQSRDLRTGLQRCAEGMIDHLELELARIWVLDSGGETLHLHATAGIEQPAPAELTVIHLGEAAVGKVAAERLPHHTDSIAEDEFIRCRDWCAEQGLVSFVALPLQVEDRLVGAVAIFDRVPLEPRVLQALSSVADGIAVGIERKRIESDLERNQTFFAAVTEQADEGIAIVDQEGRHQLVNPAYCELTGYSPDELLDKTIFALVPTDAQAEVTPLVAAGESSRRVFGIVRKDGNRFIAEVCGSPLKIAGEQLTLAIVRDITRELEIEDRHRKIEEQLRLSQRMESVGQLAGGVAHDFNNLLLVILGHVELVEGGFGDGDDRVHGSLNEIRTAAERAAVLTRQLLAFSRRQPLEFEVLDLNELIQGLLKMLRRLIPESYEIEFIPGENPGPIEADPGQLEQVLMNLAVNARDALDESGEMGKVRITTERATVDAAMRAKYPWAAEGEYVMLTVHDDGAGMTPEVAERVFDPFFTTKEVGHGTGMGLATVYGIVKQHDGLILCESVHGQGTTFRIYFPVVAERVRTADDDEELGSARGNETILVAEDDPSVRKMVAGILRQVGYIVLEADDGAEALQLYVENQEEIDLVLLDAVMPKLSGLDAYARISELNPKVPVLFTSGYSPRRIPPELFEDERLTLLLKPYGPADLLREVRHAIEL